MKAFFDTLRQTGLLTRCPFVSKLAIGEPLTYLQAHHREVVVGLGTVTVVLHLGHQCLDDLPGRAEGCGAQDAEQTVVAKLLLLLVLRFVKTVGVEKQRTALDIVNLLALVFDAREEADGGIRQHFEELTLTVTVTDNRRVVAGIAEIEVPRLQVHQPKEERDEHAAKYI